MKHNNDRDNTRNARPQLVPIRFEFTAPTASNVCIAGTFNGWHPSNKRLHPSGMGQWWKETSLSPGRYEYCFVVDGQWMSDPLAAETVPNPFGGRNSVLNVATSPEAGHRTDALTSPMKNTNL